MFSGGLWTILCRVAGVTPNGGKTGKREAAWALISIALVLTIYAMSKGVEMVSASSAVLMTVWGFAISAAAGAYKLEYDKQGVSLRPALPSQPAAPGGAGTATFPGDAPEGEEP